MKQAGKERRSGGSIVGRIFFVLGTLVLIGILSCAMMLGFFYLYVTNTLAPTLQVDMDDYTMDQSSIVYYQDKDTGEWVEYQTIHAEENRIWVDYDQIPKVMEYAAVAVEDQRFYQHKGVDWKRTLGAAAEMLLTGDSSYGGSTITQQVLKNMTQDNKPYINRKVREIFRALELEKSYTKEQIMERYLNTIALGKGCYGVQTAAQYYFGKDVSELDVAECASLIAITNNPSIYGPMSTVIMTNSEGKQTTGLERNKNRQEVILDLMAEQGYLTEAEAEAAKAEELHFVSQTVTAEELVEEATGGVEIDSWFLDLVKFDVREDLAAALGITEDEALLRLYSGGYRIYTTLDPDIQAIAESVYEDRSNLNVTSKSGQELQSGITIIEPSTGNIVATVGKIGEKTDNMSYSYAIHSKRQVGSSIKPLTVYAPAIDAGAVTPATVFDDYPVRTLNNTPWPKNSPNRYRGLVTVATGLQHSINTIAVQTVEKLGIAESYTFATEKLNLSLVADDMNISSLGLGGLTIGLSTREMAAAYAAFANNGIYTESRSYVRVTKVEKDGTETTVLENEPETHVAMKETTAYLMNRLLQNVVSAGTGTSAKFSGMTIAGKTGTTSDNYDRYFVGYTPYYVAAVWTGYETPEKISYSGNPAITMWKKVMEQIHEGLENKSFDKPSGITTVTVCADSGLLMTDACAADPRGSRAVSIEVAAGTEPTESCNVHKLVDYCTEGNCLATADCPAESITQRGVLDITREDYGESIKAEDEAYTLAALEEAVAAQEPTEENPEGSVGGCPAHTGKTAEEDDPDTPITDPSDPNYDPSMDPNSPNYNPPAKEDPGSGNSGDDPTTTDPNTPTEPSEPTDPESGGNWFDDLWNSDG